MSDETAAQLDVHNMGGAYRNYALNFNRWNRIGALTPQDIEGKRVLDWECGSGMFCRHFKDRKAASVRGIDSWLNQEWLDVLHEGSGISFECKPITALDDEEKFDLIFANTVTEHLQNLVECFNKCRTLLDKGGVLFLNHDNYYHPTGAHDHGFLRELDGTRIIGYPGPKCWESSEKCAASLQFRQTLEEERGWMWNAEEYDPDLTPDNCQDCTFYKRAQPWAHLIYQNESRKLYKHESFTTGNPFSSLNKVTPFQLRQFLVEAGFRIETWQPSYVKNEIPEVLLKGSPRVAVEDLRTWMITIRARAV